MADVTPVPTGWQPCCSAQTDVFRANCTTRRQPLNSTSWHSSAGTSACLTGLQIPTLYHQPSGFFSQIVGGDGGGAGGGAHVPSYSTMGAPSPYAQVKLLGCDVEM